MDHLETAVRDEIVALHHLLQAWFRAEGDDDSGPILARFDPGYTMIGAAGRVIRLDGFAKALPTFRGARPGLVMEIHDVQVCHRFDGGVLALYREVQSQGDTRNARWSSVLFVTGSDGKTLLWKHLQETFLP
ncbi:hypothetical protein [Nguyenibacter vanlangensis]|uniref:DUF4440 domain-containing protein n=1 Tax=Nguyenibacter vanlangensis TaxID=1216886 RepID=A0A7Y7M7B8_9PROT|nr:hypothetical protein [Nguyenibacter vanlangensis]NVN11666.1 hypothetical protein [Nguyenibacter vanlangensis]